MEPIRKPSATDRHLVDLIVGLCHWRHGNLQQHEIEQELKSRNLPTKGLLRSELSESLRVAIEAQLQHLPVVFLSRIRALQIESLDYKQKNGELTDNDIIGKLKSRKLKATGTKAVMIDRLRKAIVSEKRVFDQLVKGNFNSREHTQALRKDVSDSTPVSCSSPGNRKKKHDHSTKAFQLPTSSPRSPSTSTPSIVQRKETKSNYARVVDTSQRAKVVVNEMMSTDQSNQQQIIAATPHTPTSSPCTPPEATLAAATGIPLSTPSCTVENRTEANRKRALEFLPPTPRIRNRRIHKYNRARTN